MTGLAIAVLLLVASLDVSATEPTRLPGSFSDISPEAVLKLTMPGSGAGTTRLLAARVWGDRLAVIVGYSPKEPTTAARCDVAILERRGGVLAVSAATFMKMSDCDAESKATFDDRPFPLDDGRALLAIVFPVLRDERVTSLFLEEKRSLRLVFKAQLGMGSHLEPGPNRDGMSNVTVRDYDSNDQYLGGSLFNWDGHHFSPTKMLHGKQSRFKRWDGTDR